MTKKRRRKQPVIAFERDSNAATVFSPNSEYSLSSESGQPDPSIIPSTVTKVFDPHSVVEFIDLLKNSIYLRQQISHIHNLKNKIKVR